VGVKEDLLKCRRALLEERKDLTWKVENQLEVAKETFDLIFHKKFKSGGDWLDRTKKVGRRDKLITNLLGGVRHLYAHLHPERHVQSAMDRRGANSAIQGPSSDLGFVGGYMLRKLIWEWFESRDVMIGCRPCNSVHDSVYLEVPPINIPLVNYLCEHAYSSMLHRWMRDCMNYETNISFEMDCAVGPCLSEMNDGTRWDAQIEAIRKGLEWKRDNLGSKQPIDKIMTIVEHNALIIFKLRRKEIKKQLDNNISVSYEMGMNKGNCLEMGLIFKSPSIPQKTPKDATLRELA